MTINILNTNTAELTTTSGTYLCSYNSIVALRHTNGTISLGPNWEYSRTTMKRVNQFLNGQSAATTRTKIATGEITINPTLGSHI